MYVYVHRTSYIVNFHRHVDSRRRRSQHHCRWLQKSVKFGAEGAELEGRASKLGNSNLDHHSKLDSVIAFYSCAVAVFPVQITSRRFDRFVFLTILMRPLSTERTIKFHTNMHILSPKRRQGAISGRLSRWFPSDRKVQHAAPGGGGIASLGSVFLDLPLASWNSYTGRLSAHVKSNRQISSSFSGTTWTRIKVEWQLSQTSAQ